LAAELCGSQGGAAWQRQQARCQFSGPRDDFALELVDSVGQRPDAGKLLSRQIGDQAWPASQLRLQQVEALLSAYIADGRGAWIELVDMPAQPVLNTGSLTYEILAMIHEEAQLTAWGVQGGCRKSWFTQGCSGNRQRVDGVRLSSCSGGTPGASHEFRRHPENDFAGAEQVALQPS
jgi:hypothetical protein